MSVFGNLATEKPGIGGFFTKIGGKFKTVIGQTKSGVIKLMAGQFSNIKINARLEKVDISAKNYNKISSTGFQSDIFEENASTPLSTESRTRHMAVFTQRKESKRESDVSSIQSDLGTEEVGQIPLISNYVGKAVIRAGQVSNKSHGYYGQPTHTYEVDTRQSTGAVSTQKDTVTNFKLGYQGEHFPYSGTTWKPGGTMIEVSAKRNVPLNVSSYVWRYGKYEGDYGTKFPDASPTSVPGGEPVSGEIFKHQVLDGLNYGVPYGLAVVDPLGEGESYSSDTVDKAERAYSESFGVLDSVLLVGNDLYGSVWRHRIHSYDPLLAGGLSYTRQLGGGPTLAPFLYKSEVLNGIKEAPSAKLTKEYTSSLAGAKYVLSSTGLIAGGEAKIELENSEVHSTVRISAGGVANAPTSEVLIGVLGADESGVQQLVTKSWVMNLFNSHVHPTAAVGPPSPPIPMPDITAPHFPISNFTSILKAE